MTAPARAALLRRRRRRHPLRRVLYHAAMLAVGALFLLPFYWMLISAFKSNADIFASTVAWWPDPIRWGNLSAVLNRPDFPFLRQLGNSVFYAATVSLGICISCSLVGYSFGCLRWQGRDTVFAVTVAALMVPPIVTFLPTFIVFSQLRLTGTYVPLVAPAFLGDAFFIFMMRQFFRGVPREIIDAARLDGASEFRIFWQIVLPMVQTALVVVALFAIVYTWQEFFAPLIYLQDRNDYPLSLGLFSFRSQRRTEWALAMMGSLLTSLPLILLFLFGQRQFRQGFANTGLR